MSLIHKIIKVYPNDATINDRVVKLGQALELSSDLKVSPEKVVSAIASIVRKEPKTSFHLHKQRHGISLPTQVLIYRTLPNQKEEQKRLQKSKSTTVQGSHPSACSQAIQCFQYYQEYRCYEKISQQVCTSLDLNSNKNKRTKPPSDSRVRKLLRILFVGCSYCIRVNQR